jgi:chitodextrinase
MKNVFYQVVIVAALSLIGSKTLVYGQAVPQQATPLQNGDKVLFIGNSFTEWSGPLPGVIQALIKASGSGLNVTFDMKVKGLGIFKEYATWNSLGMVAKIREGGYKYVVLQGWYDAINTKDSGTLEDGTPNPLSNVGYPQCQDTMLKYFKILDQEIKNIGATTILYEPHVAAPSYISDEAISHGTYAKLKHDVSCFHAPIIWAWDSVQVRYPTTNYACANHTSGSFIDLLYNPNDCGHQSGDGIILDGMTFYAIFTQRSAETLKPVFGNGTMSHPEKYEEYAKIGYNTGKSILALNNSSFTDVAAPSIPSGLNTTNLLADSYTLNWIASIDNIGVLGYHVYKDDVLIATVSSPKLSVGGLLPGTSYAMKIKAFDSEGNISDYSSVLNVVTGSAIAIDTSGVLMNWNFTGQQGLASVPATKVIRGISASSPSGFFSTGTKLIPSASNADIYYVYNQTALTIADAITRQEYFTFTVTPQPGNKVSINTVSFSAYSQNQPRNFVLMSNVKGFTVGQEHGSISAESLSNFTISVTGIDSVATPVELRLYITLPASSSNQFESVGIDNLSITGRVKGKPLPSFPTNLTISGLSETGFALKWSPTSNGAAYEVFKDGVSVGTTPSLTMNINNVSIDGVYSMTVVSKDGAGNPSESSLPLIVTIPDLHNPSVPTNLTATVITDHGFNLYWNSATDNVGVVLYEIFRNDTLFGNTAASYLPIPYLSPGRTYKMQVRSKDAAGNISALSSAITVTTLSSLVSDIDAPSVPLNLIATGMSDKSFILHWDNSTDNIGVVSYEIYENNTLLGNASINQLSVSGLSAATMYHVKVRAKDAAGNLSAFSIVLNVTTANQVTVPGTTLPGTTLPGSGLPDILKPSVPMNLTATGITQVLFILHWDNATDNVTVTSYDVFKGDSLYGSTTVNYLPVTDLSVGTTYHLKVRAKDAAGNLSAFSTVLDVTTESNVLAIENEIINPISISPNPATSMINIITSSKEKYKISLSNVYGNILKSIDELSETTTIDVSSYPEGVYIVAFENASGRFTKKLVIQK